MSLSRATVCVAGCAIVVLVMPCRAWGQADAPRKPQAADPNTVIDAYLGYEIARLGSADYDEQKAAREEIIKADKPTGAGADYFGVFDAVLNTQLSTLESAPGASIRAKIAAGIICERVATDTLGAADKLADADRQLLADPTPAVEAHGLKAAVTILAAMFNDPAPPPPNILASAIIKAVKIDTPASMVDDAWNAMTLNNQTVPPGATLQMAPFVRQFLNVRRDQYVAGAPNNPNADYFGVLLLCSTFDQQSKADQTASMQAISDIIAVAGERANAKNATDLSNTAKMLENIYKGMASTKSIGEPMVNPLKDMQMKVDKKAILQGTQAVCANLSRGPWGALNPPPQIIDK